MIIDKNPFPTIANIVKPSKQEDMFTAKVNEVTFYYYKDFLDALFIPRAYMSPRELNESFIKRIYVKRGILSVCLRCRKYYDEVNVVLQNMHKKGFIGERKRLKNYFNYLKGFNYKKKGDKDKKACEKNKIEKGKERLVFK